MKSTSLFTALALSALATAAHAQVINIDQAKALAGNVTPGDLPGFPIQIRSSGSYRLSGPLTVPDNTTRAIEIIADDVTLDLNGFAVRGALCGPVRCVIGAEPWNGIEVQGFNARIHGGTVANFSGNGIRASKGPRLHDMRLVGNGQCGARLGFGGHVTSSLVRDNRGCGLEMVSGLVSHNTIANNANTQLLSINVNFTLADTNRFDSNVPDWMSNVRSLGNNLCNSLLC
jgi:hypothetical protein